MPQLLALSIGLVVLISAPSDAADLIPAFAPANAFVSDGRVSSYIEVSRGVNFTPRSDLLVEAIGAHVTVVDRLINPWEVAIYAAGSREQLRTALVPTGKTETTRLGEFRYVPIPPLRLTEGVVYQLTSYNFGSSVGVRTGSPNDPNFSIGASADIEVIGAFRHHKTNLGHVSFAEHAFGIYRFGGGFLYRAVPEPTALALAAMLAGWGMMGRRRGGSVLTTGDIATARW